MMSWVVAFQTNGLGSLFDCSDHWRIAVWSSGTLVKTPRLSMRSVSSSNQPSIRLVLELEAGVKCRYQRRRSLCASHLVISGA